jgi:hypothetical protein
MEFFAPTLLRHFLLKKPNFLGIFKNIQKGFTVYAFCVSVQKPHVINGKEIDCNNALCKSQLPPPKKHRSEEEVAVGMAQGIMMMELKVGLMALQLLSG